jgi:hypothetical protein
LRSADLVVLKSYGGLLEIIDKEDIAVESTFLGKDDVYYARLSTGATHWQVAPVLSLA